jgi:nucleoside-diphosphate-sugar epimerase
MKVLVTGATGFLGGRLVRKLLSDNIEVQCLVRDPRAAEQLTRNLGQVNVKLLSWVNGSLEKPESCMRACAGCKAAFHVAAALRGAPALLFMTNVIGTQELMKAAGSAGIQRFVLISSLGVYATGRLPEGGILDESCPIDSKPHLRDPYTFSKIAQEEVAWKSHQAGDVSLVVMRPGVIYGPGRECLGNRLGIRLGNYLLRMGGTQILPYTFVDNCVDAICLAGNCPGVEGQTFNIVDDAPPTAIDLVKMYQDQVHPIRVIPVPRLLIKPVLMICELYHNKSRGQLPAILTRYKSEAQWKPLQYSTTKAKSLLHWAPKVGFTTGLQQTFESLQKNKTLL